MRTVRVILLLLVFLVFVPVWLWLSWLERSTASELVPIPDISTAEGSIEPAVEAGFPARSSSAVKGANSNPVQAANRLIALKDIPDSEFRRQMLRLSVDVQRQVLDEIRKSPQLLNDIDSIRVDDQGMIYYVCKLEKEVVTSAAEPSFGAATFLSSPPVFDAPVPVSSPPVFHSRSSSARKLFLDFNGHDVSGTAWNTDPGAPGMWVCYPYSTDGNYVEFSVEEQQVIYETWLRVSEDYAPFDVDVTTEEPTWTSTTGHALITEDVDENGVDCPHEGYGGIAYLDKFGKAWYSYNYGGTCYSPAWVNPKGASEQNIDAADIAEIISHELGHNLSLNHDGSTGDEYYDGHQNGSMSWGAIMGAAYDENVTQWSKGDYYGASNTSQDDLSIIQGKLSYIADDHGDSSGTASVLSLVKNAFSITGRVEQTDDPDVFSLSIPSNCLLQVDVRTLRLDSDRTRGSNLDVLLELHDAADALVVSNNYELEVSARIVAELSPGTYYLHVKPTGVGSPMSNPATGYTSYSSLGQYVLNGSIGAIDTDPGVEPPVTATFESGFDSWNQRSSDDIDWTRNHSTPTGSTGPQNGADSSYFVFTEASGNDSYRIAEIDRVFDFSRFQSTELQFKYHMYGEDMGSLSVDVYDGTWHDNVWKRIGEQHTSATEAWSSATVDLSEFAAKDGVRIRFRGITGTSFYSDMAIDSVSITGVLGADVDLDGIPNDWELLYFGGITNANPAAIASNGVNTLLEAYIAGINPTNPASLFQASLTNASGFVVRWNATSGRVYSVQGSTDLLDGFQPLETNILWPQASWTDNVPRVESFYRIDVQLAD